MGFELIWLSRRIVRARRPRRPRNGGHDLAAALANSHVPKGRLSAAALTVFG